MPQEENALNLFWDREVRRWLIFFFIVDKWIVLDDELHGENDYIHALWPLVWNDPSEEKKANEMGDSPGSDTK